MTSCRSYAYGAVPVVLSGPSTRSTGCPTTLSWSMGLVVAGDSNFIRSAFCFGKDGGERALDQRDLECVFVRGACAGQEAGGDGFGATRQLTLRDLHAPRLVRHAAQGYAAGPVPLHDSGHGDQREGVGGPIPHLAIELRAAHRLGQRDGRDQLAGL